MYVCILDFSNFNFNCDGKRQEVYFLLVKRRLWIFLLELFLRSWRDLLFAF